MSSLRAISLPTQRIEPLRAVQTEAYRRPRTGPVVPAWYQRVDDTIEAIARFGYTPTPTLLVIGTIVAIGGSLHGR